MHLVAVDKLRPRSVWICVIASVKPIGEKAKMHTSETDYKMQKESFFRFWILGVLHEGLAHIALALLIGTPLYLLWGIGAACLGVAMWFLSREARDFEVEAGPRLYTALGFKGRYPLSPATKWDLHALRHSLSGWLPVLLLVITIYLIFGR